MYYDLTVASEFQAPRDPRWRLHMWLSGAGEATYDQQVLFCNAFDGRPHNVQQGWFY
jgi:hypothetical protein